MHSFGLSLQIVPNFAEAYVAQLIGADMLIQLFKVRFMLESDTFFFDRTRNSIAHSLS